MKSARCCWSKLVRSTMTLLPAASPRRAAATHCFRLPCLPPRMVSCRNHNAEIPIPLATLTAAASSWLPE